MAEQTPAIGPWPRGINNVDDPKSPRFQVGGDSLPFLTKAENVDLDRNGWAQRRVGRTKRLELTDGHSLWSSSSGRLFVVDAGALKEVYQDYSTREIDTGLGAYPVSFAEVAGGIYYANELKVGAVDSFWGVEMPSSPVAMPTLSGALPAGRYMVAVTAVRGRVESGARQPVMVELTANGGIDLDFVNLDSNADAVNIYCTEPNGRDLYFAAQRPPSTHVSLTAIKHSTDPLRTFGHYPPPPGRAIALFRGRMVIASGDTLYWSQPLAFHHFKIQTDVQLFPERITLLGALDRDLFVAAGSRTFVISGEEPSSWSPRLVDTRRVAEGIPLRIPSQKLPELQTEGEVLVWGTDDGFVAGAQGGQVHHLTDSRLAIDAYKQAALAYREENGLRQILMSLQTKLADTRFGTTDRMSVKVIRANEMIGEP